MKKIFLLFFIISSLANEKRIQLQPTCIICSDPLQNSTALVILPCHKDHQFHIDCITKWYEKNPNCPLCRSELCFKHQDNKKKSLTKARMSIKKLKRVVSLTQGQFELLGIQLEEELREVLAKSRATVERIVHEQ